MPPATYENFDVLIGRVAIDYQTRLLYSPAGEAAIEFTSPFSESETAEFRAHWSGAQPAALALDATGRRFDARAFGTQLYQAAFAGPIDLCLQRSLDETARRQAGLRIRLRLDQSLDGAANLPWELLYAPSLGRFLAQSDLTPIVRYVESPRPVQPLQAHPPLIVLAIIANPQDLPALAVEQEWRSLQDALADLVSTGLVVLERLEPATLPALQTRLRRGVVHLLHFMGHGFFDPQADSGGLIFEDSRSAGVVVKAETLAMLVHDQPSLRLMLLAACQSAQGSVHQPFAGVAHRLIQQGVPAVLAMQFSVTNAAAIALSQVFYASLADWLPVDTALSQARKAIAASGNELEWATPVLFSRSEDNRLFELAAEEPAPTVKIALPPPPTPPPTVTGFVGRQQELADFVASLVGNHVAIIAGMPGVGKTVLAARLARQIAGSQDRIFWHQFHEGEGIEAIIWRLAGMLYRHGKKTLWELLEGARQGGGRPPPAEVLLDHLVQQLRGQRYVICLDDFHHAEEDPLVEKAVERLRGLLADGEIDLIVTSRRMPRALKVLSFVPLGGLGPAEAGELLAVHKVVLAPELVAELHRHTGGNAELLMLAAQALQRSRKPEQVVAGLADEDNIETFLLEEVDRGLAPDEKGALSGVAALLGYPGTRDAIEATMAGANLKRTLLYLAHRFLLREQDGRRAPEYLTHAIVQAFYYDVLSRRERQEMHQRAGEYYEREELDLLKAALHYQRAGEVARSAELATADIRGAINQGQVRLLRALLVSLSQGQLEAPLRIRVHLAIGEIEAFLDAGEAAQAAFEAALAGLTTAASIPAAGELEARICLGMATLLARRAPQGALGWIERGLASGGQTPALQNRRGVILIGQAHYPAAIAALEQALALLPATPSQLRASVLTSLGTAWAWGGDGERGQAYTAQALAVSTALYDTYGVLTIVSNIGIDKEISGDWAGAQADYAAALVLAEQVGSLSEQARIHNLLGTLRLHQGNHGAAETHLVQAAASFRQINNLEYLAATLPVLAQLQIEREEWEPACAGLAEAETLATAHGWEYILPETYTTQAQLALAQHDPAAAQQRAEQAIAVASELGQPVEEGKAWRVKGQALAAGGQIEAATSALEQGIALLSDKDPYETARSLLKLAGVLALAGDAERSAGLRSEAEATLHQLGAGS